MDKVVLKEKIERKDFLIDLLLREVLFFRNEVSKYKSEASELNLELNHLRGEVSKLSQTPPKENGDGSKHVMIKSLTDNDIKKLDNFFDELDKAVNSGDVDPEHVLNHKLNNAYHLWRRCSLTYRALVEIAKEQNEVTN